MLLKGAEATCRSPVEVPDVYFECSVLIRGGPFRLSGNVPGVSGRGLRPSSSILGLKIKMFYYIVDDFLPFSTKN